MKKITNFVLSGIGVIGAVLVGEGLITGEELSAMQNVIGLALGGGALSLGLVISIIQAIPKQLAKEAFNKLVEKYGEDQVLNVLNKFDDVVGLLNTVSAQNQTIIEQLEEAKTTREALLNE